MQRRSAASRFLLLIVAAICSLSLVGSALQPTGDNTVRASCLPHEREALLAFKQGMTSDPAGLLDSWQQQGGHDQQQDCCRWSGVRCSNSTGHVLELQLRNEHQDFNDEGFVVTTPMVGQISRSLLSLERLEHLDLSWNNLNGPPTGPGRIPEFLGSLRSLKYLNLSGIPFLGSVPPQLGNLSNLQYLDLSHMTSTYSTDLSWLARLPSLQYLSLLGTNLSTVADWPYVVNMVPSLRVMDLSICSITSANQSLPHLNLTNIEELDLSLNYFAHPIASCWFWNLTNLKYLDLADAHLFGQLPDALGGLTSLEYLDLSYNAIHMSIKNFNNLCSLYYLDLEGCFLNGDVAELFEGLPKCSENSLQELHLRSSQLVGTLPKLVEHLTSLVVLDLSHNNITGPLPTFIGHFASLMTLDVSFNHFTGGVPHEIFVANLIKLDLSHNDLQGSITEDHFASLKSLQYIGLSYNSLKIQINSSEFKHSFRLHYASFATCQMGPLFPGWLQWHVDLYHLDLSRTGIIDKLPLWFSNAFRNVLIMDISDNQLSGGLPTDMEKMSLETLSLRSNNLTGQIPPLPRNITGLELSMNSFSGPLPSKFGEKLTFLFIASNHITGGIPNSICKSEELIILNLANNVLTGEVPMCFGMTKITNLELSNNSLSGKFPSFLQNCPKLTYLDLGDNQFSGSLPEWIGNFKTLRLLRLSRNKFSGSIPTSITNLNCLQYLDLSHNDISGSLPRNLMNFTAMSQKYFPLNYTKHFCDYPGIDVSIGVNLSENTKGHQLNYDPSVMLILMDMMSIDLSSNYLTGEVPEEIGSLHALANLNISQNRFSGNVPNKIGTMQSLESLDLSRNMLSGEIPTSLSDLTFLSYMDLSYNNLTGRIPSGSQLDTLYAANPSMYTGNVGLCGPPLKITCSSAGAPNQSTRTEGPRLELFYIGIGCGFVAGIWVVFFVLLFKKRWRIALFCYFDRLYDEAYVFMVVAWTRRNRKITAT